MKPPYEKSRSEPDHMSTASSRSSTPFDDRDEAFAPALRAAHSPADTESSRPLDASPDAPDPVHRTQGRITATEIATSNGETPAGKVAILVHHPIDTSVPLQRADNGAPLADDVRATADVIGWFDADDPDLAYIVKNAAGPVGAVHRDVLLSLLDKLTDTSTPPVISREDATSQRLDVSLANPLAAPPARNDPAVEDDGVPVIQVREHDLGSSPNFLCYEDGAPVPVGLIAKASLVFSMNADGSAMIVKNAFGRSGIRVRPTAASLLVAKARRLHGKTAEELKCEVKKTARRTGPPQSLALYAEMEATFILFPEFLAELNLTAEELLQLIKLVNNALYCVGIKCSGQNLGFQVQSVDAAKVQICAAAALPWVWVGNHAPTELAAVALLRRLTNFRAARRGSNGAS